jgi:hypothetical protein
MREFMLGVAAAVFIVGSIILVASLVIGLKAPEPPKYALECVAGAHPQNNNYLKLECEFKEVK